MEGTKIEDEHRECLLAQFITERKSKLQRDQPNEHPRRHGDPPSSRKIKPCDAKLRYQLSEDANRAAASYMAAVALVFHPMALWAQSLHTGQLHRRSYRRLLTQVTCRPCCRRLPSRHGSLLQLQTWGPDNHQHWQLPGVHRDRGQSSVPAHSSYPQRSRSPWGICPSHSLNGAQCQRQFTS